MRRCNRSPDLASSAEAPSHPVGQWLHPVRMRCFFVSNKSIRPKVQGDRKALVASAEAKYCCRNKIAEMYMHCQDAMLPCQLHGYWDSAELASASLTQIPAQHVAMHPHRLFVCQAYYSGESCILSTLRGKSRCAILSSCKGGRHHEYDDYRCGQDEGKALPRHG